MCQELQIFAVVCMYMYLGASLVLLDFVIVIIITIIIITIIELSLGGSSPHTSADKI